MIASFFEMPLGSLAVVTAILCVALAWIGTIFVRPILRLFVKARGSENTIIGNVLSSFGVLYGILLGLTAVAAYQNWSTVDANLTAEASAMVSTYQTVSSFPEPDRQNLRLMLQDLAKYAVQDEWPLMRQGGASPMGRAKTEAIQSALVAFQPGTKALELMQSRAISQFNSFLETRRLRFYSAGSGIPGILWYVVIIGAVINMVLIWLLEARFMAQLFLSGLLAVFLGAMILLVAVLSKPFQSPAGVTPAALVAAQEFMMKG